MDGLVSQTEARRQAKEINETGQAPFPLIAIAVPYPINSWGGKEKGWTVTYTMDPTKKSQDF